MQKFNKYIKMIFVLCIILIIIFSITLIPFAFGRIFLKITPANEMIIMEMISNNQLEINGQLKKIGKKQELGDWILYFEYVDGHKQSISLDDSDARDLYNYIDNNGFHGDILIINCIKICFSIVLICIIYIISYILGKKLVSRKK